MPNLGMIKSVISEYGAEWLINRSLYSLKLKTMRKIPKMDGIYEKNTVYPERLNLFRINIVQLKTCLLSLTPKEKTDLITIADKACKGIITGFSSIELNYGIPIDWQLNPITGKRCDESQKWYKIPDFDIERGDIKVIWEASRFSHFISLSRAYLLTRDSKYYEAFSLQLKEWLKKNPYGYGANYKCSQECSLRMVNTLLAYAVFNEVGVASDADASNVKDLVDRCYRKVLSNFFYAYKCIKNNHTISELLGMIVGSWCCKDQKRLDKAYSILDDVICEQFTKDGGYHQFSFNYQRLALQDIECVLSIRSQTKKTISQKSIDRIERAAFLMYQCQDETGDMPNYGSNDGALVFPVTSCGYRDFRPVINTVYALSTGKQLFDGGNYQEELVWFSGGKGIQEYSTQLTERYSSQFTDAGLFTFRGRKSWAMVVANDYTSRPAHMDQFHLDLWVDGINVLCDTGTYSYASEIGRELAKNVSHNTVLVDGIEQMNASGPFMIYDWSRRFLDRCSNNCIQGIIISINGYTHARKITMADSSYIIIDKVNKDFKVLFHTPCEVSIEKSEAILSYKGRQLCRIVSNGEMKLEKSRRSLFYLQLEDISCLSVEGRTGEEIKTVIEIIEGEDDR